MLLPARLLRSWCIPHLPFRFQQPEENRVAAMLLAFIRDRHQAAATSDHWVVGRRFGAITDLLVFAAVRLFSDADSLGVALVGPRHPEHARRLHGEARVILLTTAVRPNDLVH